MDVKAVSQSIQVATSRAASVRPAAGQAQLAESSLKSSSAALNVVRYVSESSRLNPAEKAALIDASALVDQLIHNPVNRSESFQEVAGLAVFLSNSGTDDYPKWSVLTGLRYYGANIPAEPSLVEQAAQQTQVQVEQRAVAKVQAKVSETAEISRQVTREVVQQAVRSEPKLAQKVAQVVGPVVDQSVAGVGPSKAKVVKPTQEA